MSVGKLKNLILGLVSVASSLLIVFANWFLVDPFHIRNLPVQYRSLITGLVGIALGVLLYLSLRAVLLELSSLRSRKNGLLFLMIGTVLFLALDLKPAPNRFSVSQLEVRIVEQPVEVRLKTIRVGEYALAFEHCSQIGNWQAVGEMLVISPGDEGRISCLLKEPPRTLIEVVFSDTAQPASAEVALDGKVHDVDLFSSQDNQAVFTHLVIPIKLGYPMALMVRLVDALFLILLGYGAVHFDRSYSGPEWGRQAITTVSGFNEWFEESTPRFQWAVLLLGALSLIMSGFLLLQPVFSGGTRPVMDSLGKQNKPNIIFIIVDALSADDMSMFGYSLPTTPELEQITRSWSVYSNAQSPFTCTVMSFPAYMTGRYPYTSDYAVYGDMAASGEGWVNLPQILKDAGYQTWWSGYLSPGFYRMGSGFEDSVCRPGNVLHTALRRSWFKNQAISKINFPFIPFTLDQLNVIEEGQEDFDRCEELDALTNLLETPLIKTPFFIYYHYRGVHGIPYRPGEYAGSFLPKEVGLLSFESQSRVYGGYDLKDQSLVDDLRLRYDEAILNQDEELSDFIGFLKKQGYYDSSMIVITADHGQSFNNGFSSHCTPLVSHAEAHVPLLIKYPGQDQGQRYDTLVSTVDIAPTILDAAGVRYVESWFDGVSLLKSSDGSGLRRIVFTNRATYGRDLPSYLAVTDGRFRLVMRADELYLFDAKADPIENQNIWDSSGYADLPEVQRLKQGLDNYIYRAQLLQEKIRILDIPPLLP